jgi:hypothetical protein
VITAVRDWDDGGGSKKAAGISWIGHTSDGDWDDDGGGKKAAGISWITILEGSCVITAVGDWDGGGKKAAGISWICHTSDELINQAGGKFEVNELRRFEGSGCKR